MKFKNDLLIENDKTNCPYLLAASFSGLIKFCGSHIEGNTLYWSFSPKEDAVSLINRFETKTEPHIPAKDIFQAIETFWLQIHKFKLGGQNDIT